MRMTDEKLIELWGQDLYDYCKNKSIELIGYPDFEVMIMAAIGKLHDDGILVVRTKVPGL